MKLRYLAVLAAIILLVTISASCSNYEMIGKGGPDRIPITMKTNETIQSLYQIRLGHPDPDDFSLEQLALKDQNTSRSYLINETLKGHIFEFQGQIKVGDCDYCTLWLDKPAKLLVACLDDVTCEQKYREPLTCIVARGYIVDHDGNLHRIEGVALKPDANKSGWRYFGFGYLVRVQRMTERLNSSYIPDQGQYDIKWSFVQQSFVQQCPVTDKAPAVTVGTSPFANISSMKVVQFYQRPVTADGATIVVYKITASNTGETRLKNVTLDDTLPLGMDFDNVYYSEGGSPDFLLGEEAGKPCDVTVSLGYLDTGESRSIILKAKHDGDERAGDSYGKNSVIVYGEAPDKFKVSANNDTSMPSYDIE
jgi:uncharacterized repeat protein (TIGR01451 family)